MISQPPCNTEWWEVPQLGPWPGQQEWGWVPEGRDNRSIMWLYPRCLPFCQIIDSRAIEAQHQLYHQCCQCLRGQEGWDIHAMADIPTGNQEAIWRSTCQSLRMRIPKMLSHTRVGAGTMYHWAGCQDCTLLPYAICSLQGYPGELIRSSGMDTTLDDILNILDEHYNNVKALDALNQELFQMQWAKRRQ